MTTNTSHSAIKLRSHFSSQIKIFENNDDSLTKVVTFPVIESTVLSQALSSRSEAPSEIKTKKTEYKKLQWGQDTYKGSVVNDNLHGHGFYATQQDGKMYFYDGQFYMNHLEGYCQVFYEDGSHFQGLFKSHQRFGPGVLTHPDDRTDVGFWKGQNLIRVTTVVSHDLVPQLATTHAGKSKLIRFKHVISIKDNQSDLPTDFNLNQTIFNINIRNYNSLFFNRQYYDTEFFDGNRNCIKVVSNNQEDDISDNSKQVKRFESLKSMIEEVEESLQTFVTIRESLTKMVNRCKTCCQPTLPRSKSEIEEEWHDFSNEYDLDFSASIHDEKPSVCECAEVEFQDGLITVEEQLYNIQKQEKYYRNIRDELKKKLKTNSNLNQSYKLVEVTELFSWNNETSMMDIQKHCFTHRNSEDMVNFNVSTMIMGNRNDFPKSGPHEHTCKKFLLACGRGQKEFVRLCLKDNTVHVNLTDSRGNSGIFFASIKNQIEIVSLLTNFGANLNQLNDEQLTPLSICLLNYISAQHGRTSWEQAFLPESTVGDVPDLPNWYKVKSFQSIPSMTSINSGGVDQTSSLPDSTNARILNLLKKLSTVESGLDVKSYNPSYIFNLNCYDLIKKDRKSIPQTNKVELDLIELTILTLLDYGANSNACLVPQTPLFLALFTKNPNIILKSNANVFVTMENNLTCLHVVASLPPCLENIEIFLLLLKHGVDANIRTDSLHWEEKITFIKGNIPNDLEIEDVGKNVLHLLCMRMDYEGDESDFFCSIARMLLTSGLDASKTYLGHTPLSLAVLIGHMELVQCLLKSNLVNPYQLLTYGMGNILTLYTLPRYQDVLSIGQCKAMLSALEELNVNVLDRVGAAENAIAFAEDDQFCGKQKKDGKKITLLKEFLKLMGSSMIIKKIQLQVSEILYEFTEENQLMEAEIAAKISEYLQPQEVVNNLKLLFGANKIEPERLDMEVVKAVVKFVDEHKKVKKSKKPEPPCNVEAVLKEFENLQYVPSKYLIPPGLDDLKKYQVCFQCLTRGKDCLLKTCPRCQLIQFCSLKCNKLNIKAKSRHPCNLLFYDIEESDNSLSELVANTRQLCHLRVKTTRENKMMEETQKLISLWKSDTYGTKFLQIMPLLQKNINLQTPFDFNRLQQVLDRGTSKLYTSPRQSSFYSLESVLSKIQEKDMSRLFGRDISDNTLRSKQSSRRSTIGSSTVQAVFMEPIKSAEKSNDACKCKSGWKSTVLQPSKKTHSKVQKPSTKRELKKQITESTTKTTQNIVKQLKTVPERYQKFVEILGKYFPDFDYSTWLLPYACCNDGQFYYKFCCDNDLFKESYSFA